MTTDTILPEADSAMLYISNTFAVGGKLPSDDIRKLITQACFAYHKRRLEECGDAATIMEKIVRIAWANYEKDYQVSVAEALPLLQLHTAKAVEEAIQKLTPEQVHNLCHDLEKTVSPEDFAKGCEDYQKKLFGRCPTAETIATLQKQCDQGTATIHRWQKLIADLEKEREDLRTDRDTIKLMAKYLTNEVEDLRTRAEKAEAEVAELKHELEQTRGNYQYCANERDDNKAALNQLQQDVRPLLEALNSYATCGYPMVIYPASYPAKKALETFLTKHPELKT